MDNAKTGAFIKACRKELHMTQKDLAGQLHVTDRAVSKWERGLCAPDISLLAPLAAALAVTIPELIAGERASRPPEAGDVDTAVTGILDYSARAIAQSRRAARRKTAAAVLGTILALLLAFPALNGLFFGDGFAWRCIPAYLCAQKAAQALVTNDPQAIQTYIGNADGLSEALDTLAQQDVDIWRAKAIWSRTRLDDMFLRLEVELIVTRAGIQYRFTCPGTYRNGKVEFMQIVSPSQEQPYPDWILALSDALCTYDPG